MSSASSGTTPDPADRHARCSDDVVAPAGSSTTTTTTAATAMSTMTTTTAPAAPAVPPTPVETYRLRLTTHAPTQKRMINQYVILAELGRGVHGKVRLALDSDTGQKVAIKIVERETRARRLLPSSAHSDAFPSPPSPPPPPTPSSLAYLPSLPSAFHPSPSNPHLPQHLLPSAARSAGASGAESFGMPWTTDKKVRREMAIMKKLSHENVVRLKEVIDDPKSKKVFMVLEYMEGGQVEWTQDDRPKLIVEEARQTIRDVVLGLEYLHYQGIIHRDIKPANLLWTADHRVKISDFGVSHFSYALYTQQLGVAAGSPSSSDFTDPFLLDDHELAKTAGSPAFFAPELCFSGDTTVRGPETSEVAVADGGRKPFRFVGGGNSNASSPGTSTPTSETRPSATTASSSADAADAPSMGVSMSASGSGGGGGGGDAEATTADAMRPPRPPFRKTHSHSSAHSNTSTASNSTRRASRAHVHPHPLSASGPSWPFGSSSSSDGAAGAGEEPPREASPPPRPPITKAIDVWALGVTLYCLLFGHAPFDAETEFLLFSIIPNQDFEVPEFMGADRVLVGPRKRRTRTRDGRWVMDAEDKARIAELDEDAKLVLDLLDRLLEKDPIKRIKLEEVKRHPWLTRNLQDANAWLDETAPEQHSIVQVTPAEVEGALTAFSKKLKKSIQRLQSKLFGPFSSSTRSRSKSVSSACTSVSTGCAGDVTDSLGSDVEELTDGTSISTASRSAVPSRAGSLKASQKGRGPSSESSPTAQAQVVRSSPSPPFSLLSPSSIASRLSATDMRRASSDSLSAFQNAAGAGAASGSTSTSTTGGGGGGSGSSAASSLKPPSRLSNLFRTRLRTPRSADPVRQPVARSGGGGMVSPDLRMPVSADAARTTIAHSRRSLDDRLGVSAGGGLDRDKNGDGGRDGDDRSRTSGEVGDEEETGLAHLELEDDGAAPGAAVHLRHRRGENEEAEEDDVDLDLDFSDDDLDDGSAELAVLP